MKTTTQCKYSKFIYWLHLKLKALADKLLSHHNKLDCKTITIDDFDKYKRPQPRADRPNVAVRLQFATPSVSKLFYK